MKTKRRNLTLLELVVSLGILSALAALTLDYFIEAKERKCMETTKERGEAVRNAVDGITENDGISRFLSDMGRWPGIYVPSEGDDDGGQRLAELYDASIWHRSALNHEETISGRTIHQILREPGNTTFPAGNGLPYPDVSMSVGWRGPYLNAAASGRDFFDGWGHPWHIVTNYNLRHSADDHVEENADGANSIQVKDNITSVDAGIRIDGILSYGADHARDSGDTSSEASDRDLGFLFPHNMDNLAGRSQASLTVELRIPELLDNGRTRWKRTKNIEPWQKGKAYSIGDTVTYGSDGSEKIYCCHTAHVANMWDDSKWLNWSDANLIPNYTTDTAAAPVGAILIFREYCYCRTQSNTTSMSNPDDDPDWTRLFRRDELADQVSLLIFCPVKTSDSAIHPGVYHFFRTAHGTNPNSVKPRYRANGDAETVTDADCDGLPAEANYSSNDYNGRYLTAEDAHDLNETPRWNAFSVRRLVPGKRKVFCAFYNSKTGTYMGSEVEDIDLRPGDNRITLYLDRKW